MPGRRVRVYDAIPGVCQEDIEMGKIAKRRAAAGRPERAAGSDPTLRSHEENANVSWQETSEHSGPHGDQGGGEGCDSQQLAEPELAALHEHPSAPRADDVKLQRETE